MNRIVPILAVASWFAVLSSAQDSTARPPITGVSHMTIYTSSLASARNFYGREIGLSEGTADSSGHARFFASPRQYIAVAPLPANHDLSRLESVSFATTDAEALRRYLKARGVQVPAKVSREPDGRIFFYISDPEGHSIGFEQDSQDVKSAVGSSSSSFHRIIHVGIVVQSRAAEDAFFKDILGFRPYWHGGRSGRMIGSACRSLTAPTGWNTC